MGAINWLPTLVGALVPLVLGFIWYNPKLFGTAWMNSIGMTEDDAQKGNMPVIFGVSYLLAAVAAYNIATYMGYHDAVDRVFTHGAFHGGMLAVYTGLPILITNSLFEKRSWTNILINAGYWVITFAVMGGVIAILS